MRHWLLTWTTYGTWQPGDPRGFVSRVKEGRDPGGPRIEHDTPGEEYMEDLPGLKRASRAAMKGKPIWLMREQAIVSAQSFTSSARFRGWALLAGAVMANHVHLVVAVVDDIDPEKLLQIFKSYASRALNQQWQRPTNGTWWTESGSTRKLPHARAVDGAVRYTDQQKKCLARCEPVRIGEQDAE